jgi:putative tryptophan/tyrosine transport system substrate-binding protein
MRRRDFIAGLGSAGAWSATGAAQTSTVPVVGYIGAGRSDAAREVLKSFHQGLSENGYVDGRNVAVEYRWAEDHLERLPVIASDLVRRQVSVIVSLQSTASALAAKAATSSIPIVFEIGTDPVDVGLVASLARPGGNITGIYNLIAPVAAKRLELLHELVPSAPLLAYLVNPTNSVFAASETHELQVAAGLLGLRLLILNATDQGEVEAAFTNLARAGAGGLVIGADLAFYNRSDLLIALASGHRVPAIYMWREVIAAGGLMSYGTDLPDVWRRVGVYAGRILKGENAADLPVQQVTKMQLAINLKVAKTLDITFPTALLVRADEVIE